MPPRQIIDRSDPSLPPSGFRKESGGGGRQQQQLPQLERVAPVPYASAANQVKMIGLVRPAYHAPGEAGPGGAQQLGGLVSEAQLEVPFKTISGGMQVGEGRRG